MKTITHFRSAFFLFVLLFTACKQDIAIPEISQQDLSISNTGFLETRSSVGSATGVCDFNTDADGIIAWSPYWSDEFDVWDAAKWNVWNGGAYNNELQMYRPQNIAVSNGNLIITMKKETVVGATNPWNTELSRFNFTSGRVESKIALTPTAAYPFRRLKMAARIKLAGGEGLWPAFWAYGQKESTYGEIDILENRGSKPYVFETAYHYASQAGVDLASTSNHTITSNVSLTACYHVYEVEWSNNALAMRFDGQLVKLYEANTFPYIADLVGNPENLVLNLAVGGNYFPNLNARKIPKTAQIFVDWVRVYKEL